MGSFLAKANRMERKLADKRRRILAAARELFEETGLAVDEVVLVSPPLYSSAGMTDEAVAMVYVNASGSVSRRHQEDSEQIHTLVLARDEVEDLFHCRGRFAGARSTLRIAASHSGVIGAELLTLLFGRLVQL